MTAHSPIGRPRLVITPGEPAGCGPDLLVRLAMESRPDATLVAIADPELLAARARRLGLDLRLRSFDPRETPDAARPAGSLAVLPVPLRQPVTPGQLDPGNASYVLETLSLACDGCRAGTFDGLVTGPVHKGIINAAGAPFSGHTEFLAARCGVARPVMLLAAPGLRVALATTHLPLAQVSAAITPERLTEIIRILHGALTTRFGISRPRILVCGLNPHAGEGGHLGREEIEIIGPVLDRLRGAGWDLRGPLPADTVFIPARLAEADAVLAMYHDQGLPVLKHLGFGRAVNVTLGLPILRTSVDHGTALELAGTDHADPGSLRAAVALAVQLAAMTLHSLHGSVHAAGSASPAPAPMPAGSAPVPAGAPERQAGHRRAIRSG